MFRDVCSMMLHSGTVTGFQKCAILMPSGFGQQYNWPGQAGWWGPSCNSFWEWFHDITTDAVGRVSNNQHRYVNPLYGPGEWWKAGLIFQLCM